MVIALTDFAQACKRLVEDLKRSIRKIFNPSWLVKRVELTKLSGCEITDIEDRYEIIKEVGRGSYGIVWQAVNDETGEIVAIKELENMKFYTSSECEDLAEVKSLTILNNHPNIVKLKDFFRDHDHILYLEFEYMDCSLSQLMEERQDRPFSEYEVKNWCFQVLHGLAYMHQQGYFHRDLKPGNLLVSKSVIKIADFGFAMKIDDSQVQHAHGIGTRRYKAPESLFRLPTCGLAVDMWAMGAIMAELFSFRALFPSSKGEDPIAKICSVIGSPEKSDWAEGIQHARAINYQFPEIAGENLSALIPSASEKAIDLIKSLCSWDPCKRPTAQEALQHPFFSSCFIVFAEIPPRWRSLVRKLKKRRSLIRS